MRGKQTFKVNIDKAPSGKMRWAVLYSESCVASGMERSLRLARYAARMAQRTLLRQNPLYGVNHVEAHRYS